MPILRLLSAIILLQTLYFKFTAQPESVAIFTEIGAEPWGRIGTGLIELLSGILLLIPNQSLKGDLLAIILMLGAIMTHLCVLGISVMNDGGKLFGLALVVLISCLGICIIQKDKIVGKIFFFNFKK